MKTINVSIKKYESTIGMLGPQVWQKFVKTKDDKRTRFSNPAIKDRFNSDLMLRGLEYLDLIDVRVTDV